MVAKQSMIQYGIVNTIEKFEHKQCKHYDEKYNTDSEYRLVQENL